MERTQSQAMIMHLIPVVPFLCVHFEQYYSYGRLPVKCTKSPHLWNV